MKFLVRSLAALLPAATAMTAPYEEVVQPFVQSYCQRCHDQENHKGELVLTRFTSAEEITRDFRQWEHVITFVTREEMPPAKAEQPTPEQRRRFLKAVEDILLPAALSMDGDPGLVPPRRLSNAEYNHTIRDLTGVDLRPADAFPVDPAGGEGFNNTGEALTMSPALFRKYLAAAEQIADHALLTPTGLQFSPHPVVTFAGRQKHFEQAIIRFYEEHRVDYEEYLTAAWEYRNQPAPATTSAAEWARQRRLSPRYFASLQSLLEDTPLENRFYVRELRERWSTLAASPSDGGIPAGVRAGIRQLAGFCRQLGTLLCPEETQAIVSHAGNGPVQHIERRRNTARERDRFNEQLLSPTRRFSFRLRNLNSPNDTSLRFELETSPLQHPNETITPGFIALDELVFSTKGPRDFKTDDGRSNLPLRELLTRLAPGQLQQLQPQGVPGHLKSGPDGMAMTVPGKVTFELPAHAFDDAFEKPPPHLFLHIKATLDTTQLPAARLTLRSPLLAEDQPSPFPLVDPGTETARALKESCENLCALLPNRFLYVDDTRGLSAGFHLVEGFFRDDQPLCRSVLTAGQNRELDRLWDELHFATDIWNNMLRGFVFFERSERNFMKHEDFNPIKEEDPSLTSPDSLLQFEHIYLNRSGIQVTRDELRQLIETGQPPASHPDLDGDPIHYFFHQIRQGLARRRDLLARAGELYLRDLQQFAERACRQPLEQQQRDDLHSFFNEALRTAGSPDDPGASSPDQPGRIDQAVRATLVRILVSPHFFYLANPALTREPVQPLPGFALASRLSYFLWASMPDRELLDLAHAGKLQQPAVLLDQTRRMLRDPRVSDFAREFFGQWWRYRDFPSEESVDRTLFRDFDDSLREAMFEEPTRLATFLIQNNLPLTRLLDGDETFVNERLARHYGIGFVQDGEPWQRVDGLHEQGRAGLLGMAVFLTRNSQPQRTSPVKRGFWIVHHLLGQHIPPPPDDVVALPARETGTDGQTIRQLLARHVDDEKCARCHRRFDDYGLALEGFDAIGRARTRDLAGRAVDNLVTLPGGTPARGAAEFSRFLAAERQDEFIDTLTRKLLGYALGRSVQLSDKPLLARMKTALEQNDNRFLPLFETVVSSPQFRNHRAGP